MNQRAPPRDISLQCHPSESRWLAVTQTGEGGRAGNVLENENKSFKPNLRGTEVARGLVVTQGADTEQDRR